MLVKFEKDAENICRLGEDQIFGGRLPWREL